MEKIRLGKTNMMVSRLGFGGIPIQRCSEDEAIRVVERCLELGITFIDTANAYTTSEERICKAISGRREELILASKSLARSGDEIASHLKLSLKRLGVDYLDLYQFHNVNDTNTFQAILAPNGPMAVIEEAKRAGVVKHIGITSHSLDFAKELVKSDRFETIMFGFNFVNHEAADELLPLTREHDVGFIAMKPLAGGMVTNANLAFKYLLQFPDVFPIPGIEKVQEIEEIVQVLERPLAITEAEQSEIERIRGELGVWFCHRCDYCLPCIEEIHISDVMSVYSYAKRLPPHRTFSGKFAEMMEKAANCTECGDCEARCPYHLPIRELLAERVNWFQAEKKKYLEQIDSN